MTQRDTLPIDAILPKILAELAGHGALILQAEPGAGKTTRVPPALLQDVPGEVWVVEPRRMATILAARRVAFELGETIGNTVGYCVRFDEARSPLTRLLFMTDGLFVRRLIADPQLRGVSAVILDEFHERRAATDLALGVVRHLRRTTRPDLRLLVMSATLDSLEISQFLDNAPVVQAQGRVFPVTVEHQATLDQRPVQQQVAAAVRQCAQSTLDGDILVFLPGAGEIRRCAESLQNTVDSKLWAVHALHGTLPLAEQERALAPEARRKIVLATNIAETSITLPGVVVVIDTGLARVAGHAAWSGVSTLQLSKISKASAIQRAGRAGRVRAGHCLRLYLLHDFSTRPAFDKPEVQRTELSEILLTLAALELPCSVRKALWLSPPAEIAISQGTDLLCELGALTLADGLTKRGRAMLRYPLPPRLARLVLATGERGIADWGCLLAALLADRDVQLQSPGTSHIPNGFSDLVALIQAFESGAQNSSSLATLAMDANAMRQVQRSRQQLWQMAQRDAQPLIERDEFAKRTEQLARAVLEAFADRVARRRVPASLDVQLCNDIAAKLPVNTEVTEPQFLVIVEAQERRDTKGAVVQVRLASGIDRDWLLDLPGTRLRSETDFVWLQSGQRVAAIERLRYGALVVDESSTAAKPCDVVAQILLAQVAAQGRQIIVDVAALARLQARVALAKQVAQLTELPALGEVEVLDALKDLALGVTNMADLRGANLLQALQSRVHVAYKGSGLAKLDEAMPESVTLNSGRKVKIEYEVDTAPWIQSRLQDFFGMTQTPRIANGKLPLVLHLLAPNQRPVQVTSDLAGFWQRHYPALRKELGRRYPRHAWPEFQ